jgi:hypothetical protein
VKKTTDSFRVRESRESGWRRIKRFRLGMRQQVGDIQISIKPQEQKILIEWHGQWFAKEPPIDIQSLGFMNVRIQPGTNYFKLKHEEEKLPNPWQPELKILSY